MRGAKRTLRHEPFAAAQQAGDAVDLGGLDGLIEGQRRQNAGESFRKHRLAGPRRANHQDVVGAGGGNFQSPLGGGLAAHVAKVQRCGRLRLMPVGSRRGRFEIVGPGDHGHDFRQAARAVHLDVLHHRRFGRILHGNNDAGDPVFTRANGHRERAANRTDGAIQREFANQQVLVELFDHAHRAQDAERHRQIEARAFLAHVGRRQVDGDSLVGIAESGVDERALDALAALADGGVGHADHDGVARRA